MEEKEVSNIITNHPSSWIDDFDWLGLFLAHGDARVTLVAGWRVDSERSYTFDVLNCIATAMTSVGESRRSDGNCILLREADATVSSRQKVHHQAIDNRSSTKSHRVES